MATKSKVKSAPKRKSKVSGAPKSTMTVGGKRYTKTSCHTTKAAAKSAAEKKRKEGYNARVSGMCVFTRKATKSKK